jgi:hypothetical protein
MCGALQPVSDLCVPVNAQPSLTPKYQLNISKLELEYFVRNDDDIM